MANRTNRANRANRQLFVCGRVFERVVVGCSVGCDWYLSSVRVGVNRGTELVCPSGSSVWVVSSILEWPGSKLHFGLFGSVTSSPRFITCIHIQSKCRGCSWSWWQYWGKSLASWFLLCWSSCFFVRCGGWLSTLPQPNFLSIFFKFSIIYTPKYCHSFLEIVTHFWTPFETSNFSAYTLL